MSVVNWFCLLSPVLIALGGSLCAENEIIVTSKKTQHGPDALAVKVNLESVENTTAANIAEVLARQSSVYVNRFGPPGTHSSLYLRGQNPENAGVYLEGIPLNDIYGGGFNLENLPVFLFQELELYPTASPLHLPGSFAAGAIHLRLREPSPQKKIWLNSALHTLGGGLMGAGVQLNGQFHYAEIAGSENRYRYQDNAGTAFLNKQDDTWQTRQNEDFFQGGYTGYYQKTIHSHKISILGDVFAKERGLPGPIGVSSEHARLHNQRGLLNIIHLTPLGDNMVLQNQLFSLVQNQSLFDPQYELATGLKENQRLTFSGGAASSWQYFSNFIFWRNDLSFRLNQIWQNKESFANRIETDLGSAMDIRPWKDYFRLLLSAKAHVLQDIPQIERNNLINFEKIFGIQENLSAHLGFFPFSLWDNPNTKFEIFAAVYRSGRFPTLAENYGDGATLLPAGNLKREQSLTNSAGLQGEFTCGFLSCALVANYFLTASENMIIFIANSQQTMVAVNAGLVQLEGIESDLRIAYRRYVSFNLRYQYLEAREWGQLPYYYGKYLPYRPRHKAYAFSEGGNRFLRLFAGLDYMGRNFRDRYNSYYFFLQERIRFFGGLIWFLEGNNRQQLSYTMRNITNEVQTDVLGYPLPGRVHEIRYQRIWEGL